MEALSVVIIAKNSAATIEATVSSALLVSSDVIVMDSGSSDHTKDLAIKCGARVIETEWKGYGQTRNEGAKLALYDHVLSLDSDEVISDELANAIKMLPLNPGIIYGFKRDNFIGRKKISYGEWGHDKVYRLYNRQHAAWNLDEVHEMIESSTNVKSTMAGVLQHYTSGSLKEYAVTLDKYARLSAIKYQANNRNAGFFKNYLSGPFSFIRNYLFRLGFLDGKYGWRLAILLAKYRNTKYKILKELTAMQSQ